MLIKELLRGNDEFSTSHVAANKLVTAIYSQWDLELQSFPHSRAKS
jgi:hypothetical protein